MSTCASCGKRMENADAARPLCAACARKRLAGTWKRQMKFYGISSVLGAALISYVVWHLRGSGSLSADQSALWTALATVGGLALLGGLFGLAVAVFFHYWHLRKRPQQKT